MNPAQIQTQGSGFVYFIQAGTAGPIKIGWAYFPEVRPELRATIDEYRARPTNHTRRRFVAIGNGQHCRNCQALLTEADDTKMPTHEWWGHCRACREFAALREAGIDPFD